MFYFIIRRHADVGSLFQSPWYGAAPQAEEGVRFAAVRCI